MSKKEYDRAWREAHPEKAKEYEANRLAKETEEKRATKLAYYREWRRKNIENVKLKDAARYKQNKEKVARETKARRVANPVSHLFIAAKGRAKKEGIEFTITKEDLVVPTHCPVFGILIVQGTRGFSDASPSVDRLTPSKGYVPGNVRVISNRANCIKGDGTAEEHRMIVEYMEREIR